MAIDDDREEQEVDQKELVEDADDEKMDIDEEEMLSDIDAHDANNDVDSKKSGFIGERRVRKILRTNFQMNTSRLIKRMTVKYNL